MNEVGEEMLAKKVPFTTYYTKIAETHIYTYMYMYGGDQRNYAQGSLYFSVVCSK